MRVRELWGLYPGQQVTIVGTGPSLRVFPPELLCSLLSQGVSIGLNYAYRHEPGHLPPGSTGLHTVVPGSPGFRYYLTCHPEVAQVALAERPDTAGRWLVKRKRPLSDLPWEDERFYFFQAGTKESDPQKKLRELCIRQQVGDSLWQGGAAHCTAMSAALHMGAKTIVLLGCDMGQVADDHHAHAQHILSRGHSMDRVYYGYRHATRELRRLLREQGVSVVSLSPFLGSTAAGEDYRELLKELRLPPLLSSWDHSAEHARAKHSGRVVSRPLESTRPPATPARPAAGPRRDRPHSGPGPPHRGVGPRPPGPKPYPGPLGPRPPGPKNRP